LNRSTRIFFYSVYLVMGLVWITAVALPTWRPVGKALPLTLLLLLQGILHARLEWCRARGWEAPYLTVQTVLAAVMVWLADGSPIVEVLFAPIAGEAVGLYPDWRRRCLALLGILAALGLTVPALDNPMALVARLPWFGGAFAFTALYVVLYVRQIQERERANALLAQLQKAHAHLRAYADQIAELTLTQERQRMARELHDTLAQGLAGLVMQLEAVDELLAEGEVERAQNLIRRAMDRARRTHGEARARIQSLRLSLDQLDLAAELERELERARIDSGLETSLEIGPGATEVRGEAAAQLYYIAREAIANVVGHARARHLHVRLWGEKGRVCLSVADDGVGFDPADIGAPGHFGLTGAQERARSVGGELRIESSPGRGCTLIAAVPCYAADGTVTSSAPGGEVAP